MRMNRRDLLQTLAVGSAALSLPQRLAFGAPAGIRRVIFFYTPNGLPNNGDGHRPVPLTQVWCQPGQSTRDFTPTGMSAPLARHKDQLVYFENMSMASDSTSWMGGETHVDGMAMILTNWHTQGYNTGKPRGESLDTYLARTIGTQTTPSWPMLNLAIGTGGGGGWADGNTTSTFLANGSKVPSERDPQKVYQKLFGGGTPVSEAVASSRLVRRRSILDLVSGELRAFRARLPAEDQTRADAQLAAIRTLETRLSGTGSCANAKAPQAFNIDDGRSIPAVAAAHFDAIVAAFACDMTRIVSVVYGGCYDSVHSAAPGGFDSDMHEVSHHSDNLDLMRAKVPVFELIAKLADKLKAVPEGAGTMLDNTLIVVTSEIGDGHFHDRMPFLTVGGSGMGVNTGSYLKLTGKGSNPDTTSGYPHGNLLRSIKVAMGSANEPFGNPRYSSELVPGFLRS